MKEVLNRSPESATDNILRNVMATSQDPIVNPRKGHFDSGQPNKEKNLLITFAFKFANQIQMTMAGQRRFESEIFVMFRPQGNLLQH